MKVGDYVRTNDGRIEKYSGINDSEIENFTLNEIIKSSPNIIDLIEVGDILIIKDLFGNVSKVEVDEDFKLLSGAIISIVTKEQFESIEYKVKE